MAMKMGKPVFKAMSMHEADFIGSACPLAGHHIDQATIEMGGMREVHARLHLCKRPTELSPCLA